MKFSQQRTAIKNAEVNDEISLASLSCNSHSTFSILKGKTATGFIGCKYKTSYFCGPLATVSPRKDSKDFKAWRREQNSTRVMNTSKVAKTEAFRGDVQRVILVITAYQGHSFRSKSTNLCYKQLYQHQGTHSGQRLQHTNNKRK